MMICTRKLTGKLSV